MINPRIISGIVPYAFKISLKVPMSMYSNAIVMIPCFSNQFFNFNENIKLQLN